MKTVEQIREVILRLAQRAAGVSPRELRDSFSPESRRLLYVALAQMEASGEVMQALRSTPKAGRPARRLFTHRGAGQAWSAGLVQPQHKAKRAPKSGLVHAAKKAIRLDSAAPAVGGMPAAEVCPSGTDHRYTVPALPKGYVSALNPAECRPWANVAAQARAA